DDVERIGQPSDAWVCRVGMFTVWVRLTATEAGCSTVFSIDLIVNPSPAFKQNGFTIKACADGSGNGTGDFDLPGQIDSVIMNNPGNYNWGYYEDKDDAVNGNTQDKISNPSPYNGADKDTVYTRISDPQTGCAAVGFVVLEVIEAPTVPPLDDYELCDEGGMKADFDLDSLVPVVRDGDSSLDVGFYGSQQDAEDQ